MVFIVIFLEQHILKDRNTWNVKSIMNIYIYNLINAGTN